MLDFAENYSFLLRNATQGFHWNNSQVRIHPFVIYYVGGSGKLAHKSYVCISDQKTHDTITVYSFLKHFHEHYVSKFPSLHKVFYFSDGSAAQYINFKNFKTTFTSTLKRVSLSPWKEGLRRRWCHHQNSSCTS